MKQEYSPLDPFRMLDETPTIIERVKPKNSDEQSQLAVYIAEQTIKHLNMQDERIDRALKALHDGKRADATELKQANKLAEELDQVAFDAQDADDDDYDLAFCRARAANALETAARATFSTPGASRPKADESLEFPVPGFGLS